MARSEIGSVFARAAADQRLAVMPFLVAGDPSIEETVRLAEACAAGGADLIEIGWPFSDPIADGPTIQAASKRALDRQVGRAEVLEVLTQVRRRTGLPVLLLSYLNVLLSMNDLGPLKAAGVCGLIIPDLALDEPAAIRVQARALDLPMIPFAAPTSTDQRLSEIGRTIDPDAFVYCVSLLGVTGQRQGVSQAALGLLQRARERIAAPLAVGFGISGPDAVSAVSRHADGVIVGSALIDLVQREGRKAAVAVERFVADLVHAGHR